ncbi:zinc finger protein [Parasponia andersonii]|uniref:Zinc finger protein n=1 Tax=Parasponia andersonii TaxID=3476 RepID=A0A2P5ASF1_PARAD|nr:zinc finger protein [Parasponia andersonii]
MVWFQCEDCGDNLKKPKLPNHFRICSATKLSCIDCGEIFRQESVQGHTQCMTEMEKYGPKGQGQRKAVNGATAKPNKDGKQQPDFDINVGLSKRPPWFCSLCNTNTTSRQTLLLHAEGKKHKGKARAFHAAKQQTKKTEDSAPETNHPSEILQKGELLENKDVDEPKVQENNFEASNGNFQSSKKRKSDKTGNVDSLRKKTKDDLVALGNGEVIQGGNPKAGGIGSQVKQDKTSDSCPAIEETKIKIKWKKLITSALKSSPDGVLKKKKLRKTVLEALQESGITVDEDQFENTLDHKINSSSGFTVENKYVRLVAKE